MANDEKGKKPSPKAAAKKSPTLFQQGSAPAPSGKKAPAPSGKKAPPKVNETRGSTLSGETTIRPRAPEPKVGDRMKPGEVTTFNTPAGTPYGSPAASRTTTPVPNKKSPPDKNEGGKSGPGI